MFTQKPSPTDLPMSDSLNHGPRARPVTNLCPGDQSSMLIFSSGFTDHNTSLGLCCVERFVLLLIKQSIVEGFNTTN